MHAKVGAISRRAMHSLPYKIHVTILATTKGKVEMRTASIVFLCILALAGCATRPVGADDAKPGTIIQNPWLSPLPGTGEVLVIRDKGYMGSACAEKIYVDSQEVAELRTSQRVSVYLPPGEHIAGVQPTSICAGGSAALSINVVAGRRQVYRVARQQSGDLKIEPSAF